MSANESILVDEAEILDLINEANAAVDQLNFVTFNEEYEKKKHKIFSELEKDLLNWGKHISQYLEKLKEAQNLEEGVKYNLIKRLELHSDVNGDTKKFEGYLKKLESLLQENVKVNCGDLVSSEEMEKLKLIEEDVDIVRDLLSDANEKFDEISEDSKDAVKSAMMLKRGKKLLEIIEGLEMQLNKIQQNIIANGVKKFRTEEN